MNYYPFHIGDYLAHAAHLDPIEDCAYRRLLDQYYLNEGPLTADLPKLTRQIRMKAHADDVQAVLEEFFELGDDGWRHTRCDEEIAKFQVKQAAAQENGKRGGRPKKAQNPAAPVRGESENPAPADGKGDANPDDANLGDFGNPDLPEWFGEKNPEVISGFSKQNPELTQQKANQEPITKTNNQNQDSLRSLRACDAPQVCKAMRLVGMADVSPSHPTLLTLLDQGMTEAELVAAACESVAKGKGFTYALNMAAGRRRDAAKVVALPTRPKPAEKFADMDYGPAGVEAI